MVVKVNYSISIFLIWYLLANSCEEPFIIDESLEYCTYNSSHNQFFEATNKTLYVRQDGFEIIFKLCDKFHKEDYCPEETVACLKYKNGTTISFGDTFSLGLEQYLKSNYGRLSTKSTNCSLVIHLSKVSSETPILLSSEPKCVFNVALKLPEYSSFCGLRISGKFIDLTPLAKSFTIHTESRNFSVTLCGRDPICNQSDVNACEFIGSKQTAISLLSTLHISYAEHMIAFHGVTFKPPNNKHDKKFTVLLKCDWDKNELKSTDLTYTKIQTQGRKYSFELETSYGCVKTLKQPCVVRQGFFVYDLSGLYKQHPNDAWHAPGNMQARDSNFFIQMCGPVVLRGRNESCKSTYAQVCENVNGFDYNRGSILSHLEVGNDVLTATIDSGEKCEGQTHHQTIITFFCDNQERGPKYVFQPNTSSCHTYFEWKTPHACPKYDVASCRHIKPSSHPCVFPANNQHYNLSSLTKTQTVIDKEQNVTFKINICGAVLDSDAACTKDVSVARKNVSEPNINYRFTSLGKLFDSTVEEGRLILKYQTGAYCEGTDYHSEVIFECIDIEQAPILVKMERCFYQFLWRTNQACPYSQPSIGHRENPQCTFTDVTNMKSIHFGSINPVQFDNLTIDICSKLYKFCQPGDEDCSFTSIKNVTASFTKDTHMLEIRIDRPCSSSQDVNIVVFNLICDKIKHNHHFGKALKNGCTLEVAYYVDVVCSLEEQTASVENDVIYSDSSEDNKSKVPHSLPDADRLEEDHRTDCNLKSPYTKRQVVPKALPSEYFRANCPYAVFNTTFRYVKLTYSTDEKCSPVPSKNISYEVYLLCVSNLHPLSLSDECRFSISYQEREYCDLFNNLQEENSSNIIIIAGSLTAGLFLVSLLILLIICTRRRNICHDQSQRIPFVAIYKRDANL